MQGWKGIVVNQVFPSLHEGSIEIMSYNPSNKIVCLGKETLNEFIMFNL